MRNWKDERTPLPSSIRPRADRAAYPAPSSAAGNEPSSAAHREKHETGGKTEQPAEHLINALAVETGIAPHRIRAAVALLDADNSVPFIARYRKEATGALTDTQLRTIQSRLGQLRALEERRNRVLEALTERADEGLIDPLTLLQLRSSLMNAATIADVNAIYAPYRSERVTRAQMARAAGLDSLVEDLLEVPLAERTPSPPHTLPTAPKTTGTMGMMRTRALRLQRRTKPCRFTAPKRPSTVPARSWLTAPSPTRC